MSSVSTSGSEVRRAAIVDKYHPSCETPLHLVLLSNLSRNWGKATNIIRFAPEGE